METGAGVGCRESWERLEGYRGVFWERERDQVNGEEGRVEASNVMGMWGKVPPLPSSPTVAFMATMYFCLHHQAVL